MRAFVFTDPALTSRAGQFVWLELNVDDEQNAAHRERLTLEALPTFYVLDPVDESVVMRRVDGMSVGEMEAFLDEARAAAGSPAPASPLEAALFRADRLNGEGRKAEAAAAYREALGQAPPGWPPYGRSVVALLFLHQMLNEDAQCLALAREALPRVEGAPASVMIARSGLDCALGLPRDDPGRAAGVAAMEEATRKTLAPPGVGAAADDVSSSYLSLVQAREGRGRRRGGHEGRRGVGGLPRGAGRGGARRRSSARSSTRTGSPPTWSCSSRSARSRCSRQSERDLPDDYNPPARLAVAYLAMKKPDEALAASNRALPKVSGPRRIRVLLNRAEIFSAKGDAGGLARDPGAGPRLREGACPRASAPRARSRPSKSASRRRRSRPAEPPARAGVTSATRLEAPPCDRSSSCPSFSPSLLPRSPPPRHAPTRPGPTRPGCAP